MRRAAFAPPAISFQKFKDEENCDRNPSDIQYEHDLHRGVSVRSARAPRAKKAVAASYRFQWQQQQYVEGSA
jgi:hypothetical protein